MSTANLSDYVDADEGQWFIGVLDTDSKTVYILPISPRSPDALSNSGQRNRNRYVSGPEGKGLPPRLFWTSCPANWEAASPGQTTHHRCMHFYRLAEADCLGFSLIKLSRDGQFAQLKLTSNSLNMKDLTGGPGHSFSRSTHAADGLLPRDARNLPIDNTHVPGGTNLSAGTHCMGQGWANALVAYLNTQGLAHIAKSMD